MGTVTDSTIFALSSGPPPAGVAIVRVSGPGVINVFETIIGSVPEPRRATLASLATADGSLIDRGLVLFFPGPASFTGENVAEFHIHGGRAVVAALLTRLGAISGLRPAEPGEFTRRAFLNGRFDLTEVEGLADLIGAETEAQRRQALRQASGSLRSVLENWRIRLIRARAMVEAELDFSDEEDVPGFVSDLAWGDVGAVADAIAVHLDDDRRGERLRDGSEVVVLGAVNAGKSSLINALARRDVAIVSEEAGTTRDLIEVRLDIDGYPFTIVDTAGLREASGAVEREGIRRARLRAGAADLVLAVGDATAPVPAVTPDGPLLRVGTKADLIDSPEERSRLGATFDVLVSSVTGEGIDRLLALLAGFAREHMAPCESALITRARHRAGLTTCRNALVAALNLHLPLELRAEELRHATDALGRLTGRVDVEDLLDVIFRDFCIGK
jgi:tRNA modification GTPase